MFFKRFFVRFGIFLILFNFVSPGFSDCIDGMETLGEGLSQRVSPSPAFTEESYPQKITKTLQGITFDSDYDNGSLLDVQEAGANIFNCTIYTESGEYGDRKYWFRFKILGAGGAEVTLNIEHPQNPRPVVSFDGGASWRRLSSSEAPGNWQVVLDVPESCQELEISFFFPSGVKETYDTVSDFVRRCDSATSKSIGASFQGREMWMVTATDPATSDCLKHRVWLHSRAHAGEVTSTLLMLGFLSQIMEDSPWGRYLRENCIFNVVPLQNVDGVYLGHTRWDSQGIDPERQWPQPYRIPEVGNIKYQVDAFMGGDNPIEVALNLHSTQGNYTDTFFFKHVYPSVTHEFEAIEQKFIDAFDHATPLFDNLSAQTSQLSPNLFIESYFWNNWGKAVMAITHEGHFYKRITDNQYITDKDYHELGRAMARGLVEYFDLPMPRSGIWHLAY